MLLKPPPFTVAIQNNDEGFSAEHLSHSFPKPSHQHVLPPLIQLKFVTVILRGNNGVPVIFVKSVVEHHAFWIQGIPKLCSDLHSRCTERIEDGATATLAHEPACPHVRR